MDAEPDRRGPGLRFPPPLIVVAIVAAGYLIDLAHPLPFGGGSMRWVVGSMILGVALLLAVIALVQFKRANTHVEPWQPTTTIIQHGLYAWSRNPIYVAFCIATVGLALLFDSWWILAGLPLQVLLLYGLVIRREEAYLERKFGGAYSEYRRRVRRWI